MDPRELARASAKVQATGIPDSGLSHMVAPALHRDGSTCWGETTVQTLTDSDGAVVGYQGSSRLIGAEAALVVTTERTRSRVEAMLADRLLMTSFQPIVALATGRVIGVEALSRFIAEAGDMPEAWFTDATTVGMGPELELLAISTALTAARDLPDDLYVSINVSPLTCLDDRVEDFIRYSAIDLGRIVLELTEHTEVADYGLLNEALLSLRRSGVRIAVDDAGAGFASGQHILKIKPDIIKLDRGLITDIDTDLGVRALAAGMVSMADEIGATVTAEGIETPAELKCVTALHIDAGQGYLLGRPSITPSEWVDWNSDQPFPELLDAEPAQLERPEPLNQGTQPAPAFVFSVAVLDALPDATAILDAAGRIIASHERVTPPLRLIWSMSPGPTTYSVASTGRLIGAIPTAPVGAMTLRPPLVAPMRSTAPPWACATLAASSSAASNPAARRGLTPSPLPAPSAGRTCARSRRGTRRS